MLPHKGTVNVSFRVVSFWQKRKRVRKMLYILRHGKTDWNTEHKLQGRTDIPLNAEGREMARKAAEKCRNVHFDICYCSPLARARETAEIILKDRNVPIVYDDRLREMSFGIYEGKVNYAFDESCPVSILFRHPEQYDFPIEGAESWKELFDRTGDFLREKALPLVKYNKDVLIVGHGAMDSSIVCQVRGLPIEQFWSAGIENCRLMRLI